MLGPGASPVPSLCTPRTCLTPCRTQVLLRCLKPCPLAGQLWHQRCPWAHRNTCCTGKMKTVVRQMGTSLSYSKHVTLACPPLSGREYFQPRSRMRPLLLVPKCWQTEVDQCCAQNTPGTLSTSWLPSGDRVLNKKTSVTVFHPCLWTRIHVHCVCCDTSQHQE